MKSSLTEPLTDEEIDLANSSIEELWIHVRCKNCGDVEPCFNKTIVSLERLCIPCLMEMGRLG